jgi:DNA-binding HxlR family transcriptional regulator
MALRKGRRFTNLSQVRSFLLALAAMKFPTQCPVAFTTRILGGKWKARIVWALTRDPVLRFSDVRRACLPISDRILSRELKELEACGLLSRTEYAVVPPRTEYRLTELGLTLQPVMAAMAQWGLKHRCDVLEADPVFIESELRPD